MGPIPSLDVHLLIRLHAVIQAPLSTPFSLQTRYNFLSFSQGRATVHPELRKRILGNVLGISAIIAPLIALFIAGQAYFNDSLRPGTIALCLYTLAFPILWLSAGKLQTRHIGITFLALMLVMAFMVQIRGGLTVAPAALQLMILVLAGLFFGVRGVYVTLAINLISFSVAGYAVLNGIVPEISDTLWNPQLAIVWIRSGIILSGFGGATAIAVTYTVSKMEQETRKLRLSLQREKEQLAALELAEKEKIKARNALVEAQRVEAIGRLASGVAHDFNNSLTVIINSAELAGLDPNLSDETRSFLNSIMKSSLQAADMTRSLLALARKDPGKLEQVEAGKLLDGMPDSLSRLLPEDIEFSVVTNSSAELHVDRTQLERAILNLVINAKDAIVERGEIEIGCRNVILSEGEYGLSAGAYVEFWVKDSGHGMTEEVLKHVFELFYTTKSAGMGTGMGMSLVHNFVAEAGGSIDISSTAGIGTTVSLYIPQAEQLATSPQTRAEIELPSITESKFSILVVEDNPEVLTSTSDTLRHAGFNILEARDGDSALEIARNVNIQFDLLCIDGVIPGASSAEVIAFVQNKNPDVHVVVCSGYVEEELVLRGIRTGELAYVRKPYLSKDLLTSIRNELSTQ